MLDTVIHSACDRRPLSNDTVFNIDFGAFRIGFLLVTNQASGMPKHYP